MNSQLLIIVINPVKRKSCPISVIKMRAPIQHINIYPIFHIQAIKLLCRSCHCLSHLQKVASIENPLDFAPF